MDLATSAPCGKMELFISLWLYAGQPQLGRDNLEATTWKRQLGSDNLEATTWKYITGGGELKN